MRVVEKEGRTKEEAVRLALAELNARREDCRIEVIDEGKTGFLGLGPSKPALVRVYLVQEGAAPSAQGETAAAVAFLKDVLAKMGLEAGVMIQEDTPEQALLLIDSKDSAIIIGKHGKTLESLQYLLNIIFSAKKELQRKILLDIEGYREKRRMSLEKLAHNIASKVKRTRRPHVLEEMNPYERRIIHMTLERDRDVETRSLGRGDSNMKKIRISLKGQRGDPSGRNDQQVSEKDGDDSGSEAR